MLTAILLAGIHLPAPVPAGDDLKEFLERVSKQVDRGLKSLGEIGKDAQRWLKKSFESLMEKMGGGKRPMPEPDKGGWKSAPEKTPRVAPEKKTDGGWKTPTDKSPRVAPEKKKDEF